FERVEPVPVIGLTGIGIAGGLRALDLIGEGGRPFRPGEQAALVQCERHGEGLRLPWFAEDGPFGIARNAGHGIGGAAGDGLVDRYHGVERSSSISASAQYMPIPTTTRVAQLLTFGSSKSHSAAIKTDAEMVQFRARRIANNRLHRIEIRLEPIDRDFDGRGGVRAPQPLSLEHDSVERFGVVALLACPRVAR